MVIPFMLRYDKLFARSMRRASFKSPALWRAGGLMLVLSVALLVSACVAAMPAAEVPADEVGAVNERLSDLSEFDLPTPEAIIVPDVTAIVNTEGSRANVRTGPNLDSPIIAKALPGDEFSILGESEDGEWWEICCVRGPQDADGEATEPAWLSKLVVDVDGNVDAVPAITAVLPENVEATWQVDWQCGSERCEVKECTATVNARSQSEGDEQWLEVEHTVSWDEGCFDEDSWVFDVDRYSARERSGEFVDNFLYNYWLGVQPGPATDVYTMEDGREVAVWCSGPHEIELEEGSGWTTVYKGTTCHDVRTGELVSVTYTKRWLFSGEYDGQQYERAYFGDYEVLDQYLLDTNVELAFIEE